MEQYRSLIELVDSALDARLMKRALNALDPFVWAIPCWNYAGHARISDLDGEVSVVAPEPIYACNSKRCDRADAVYSADNKLHYHTRRPYVIYTNGFQRIPDVHVVPINRARGEWANYQDRAIVRYELIRRKA